MNRWQAITEIVTRYIDNGHPAYALAALALLVVAGLAIAILVYSIGAPALDLVRTM